MGVAGRAFQTLGGVNQDVHSAPWGMTPDGKRIELYTLTSGGGLTAEVANYGATLLRLLHGTLPHDVVLGFDDLRGYTGTHPYFGATVGRYANRIARAQFTLDGTTAVLTCNDGAHSLHGGLKGFDKVVWHARGQPSHPVTSVELSHVSPDGDQGYPGTLTAIVRYSVSANDILRIEYDATTDQPTVVSLANHAYFNLTAGSSDSILGHELTIDADAFLPVGPGLIPTGEIRPVAGTPFDFRTPRTIGSRINDADGQLRRASGYDHCFVLNGGEEGRFRFAARLTDPASGRTMEVHTTCGALQLYTGNLLDGTIRGKAGQMYRRHHGVCLETERYPNAPNVPCFPSPVLRPPDRYSSVTEYRFVG
jgi:aldose 1-epimerase